MEPAERHRRRAGGDSDGACAADPTCPVTAAGGVLAAYDELARRLDAGEVGGPGVGPTQLAYAAFSATYAATRWPRLWSALARASAGDLVGHRRDGRLPTRAFVSYAPFALVTCLDGDHAVGYEAWQADVGPHRAGVAPLRPASPPTSCCRAPSGRRATYDAAPGDRDRGAPRSWSSGARATPRRPSSRRSGGRPPRLAAPCSPSTSPGTSPSATLPVPPSVPPATSSSSSCPRRATRC